MKGYTTCRSRTLTVVQDHTIHLATIALRKNYLCKPLLAIA